MGLSNYFKSVTDSSSENNLQKLIKFLAERSQVNNIFIVGNNIEHFLLEDHEKINSYVVRDDVSMIDKLLNKKIISWLQFTNFDKELIKNSIIFCNESNIKNVTQLSLLAEFSRISPFIIFKNPNISVEELSRLNFAPTIEGTFEESSIILSGKYANPDIVDRKLKILAIIAVFNEIDFIEKSIIHFIDNGVDVHILDNWSTDGSYEVVQNLAKNNKGLTYERFPEEAQTEFFFKNILTRKQQIAKEGKYDWYFHSDSDEIRTSPWKDKTLNQAISIVDILGFNAVDFTVIDFRPTKDGYSLKQNPEEFFTHFEFGKRPGHFIQVKCWKGNPEVDLIEKAGHNATFNGRKIFPLKFLLKHYPLRSTEQAQTKLFKDRIPRVERIMKENGWHTHYKMQGEIENFIWDKNELLEFDEEFYSKYIIERLTGVGII